jgi:hypothetical protein
MSPRPSPLLGYNTNVRHKGKVYHIQTEDSGVDKPHIITHLFADGGRIIASKKTDYSDQVTADNLAVLVKAKMQAQHKAMFIALRDGTYDEPGAAVATAPKPATPVDRNALDRAAEAKLAGSAALRNRRRRRGHRIGAAESLAPPPGKPTAARNKELDDVILSYLSDDENGAKSKR